jgi:DMSO/TMAO reductase YedYZ molybdopterin-dependent catalytic subunit
MHVEAYMEKPQKITRRDFMAAAGGSIVSIGLPGVFVKLMDLENSAMAAELRPDGRPRIPPGQHAVKTLRKVGGVQGELNLPEWRLDIRGEVDDPLTLNRPDLMKLTQVDQTCDVHCVTGWTLLDSRWHGIAMNTIMDLVKVKDSAGFVVFEAPGGFTSSVHLSEAKKDNVILAHGLFDQALSQAHGAPLRALIPDKYFYKSVKWLTGIHFVAEDEPGYYESLGYSNSADPWKEERYDDD